jgi:uncharacterized protein YndB with AHSA1/START domain
MAAHADTRYSLTVQTLITARTADVWEALVDPVTAGEIFWGTTVESDFKVGRPIVWKGTWEGKPFEDRGIITQLEEGSLLQYSHWTGSGTPPDESQRNLITFRVAAEAGGTRVSMQHENISSPELKEHSEKNWSQLLARMKEILERRPKS